VALPTPGVTPANWGAQLNAEIAGELPDTVSGLAAWYKADAITGKVNGDPISQWDDSSGNARHLTQATSGKQPTYVTTTSLFNGLPCVRFAGTDDTLANTSVTGMATMSGITVVVVDRLAASADQDVMHLDNTAGVNVVRSTYELTGWGGEAGGSNVQGTLTGQAGRGTGIRTTHYDGSTVTVLQGTSALGRLAATGTVTTTRIFMGSYRDGANYMTGDVAEVCVYNKALSAAERATVVKGLAYKYQIGIAA
jgi:hypothetical protein